MSDLFNKLPETQKMDIPGDQSTIFHKPIHGKTGKMKTGKDMKRFFED